ncbi:glycosyltransferase family 4 protein [Ramlibacter sp. AN1133]|uniref:glycosyltransferase family 4 protein n=1 Tax=Ramlibacter sp. AN1133 TaxID=3133429 RepID=UPI0030BF3769
MSEPRVLFVAHDAYRAGATIFLLNMLRWIRERTSVQFQIAFRNDGEMVAEFEEVCRTHVLAAPPDRAAGIRGRVGQWLDRRSAHRRQCTLQSLLDSAEFDVLYLNTITLGDQLAALRRLRVPVITHVHELSWAIQRYARGEERRVLETSARLICVSEAVRSNLVNHFACPAEKALCIRGFVPVHGEAADPSQEQRKRLLEPFAIPENARLIGMCGHGDIRKGVDLVVPLARLLPVEVAGLELHIVWIGALAPEYPREVAIADARRAGVDDRLHFTGVTPTPGEWLSLLDVHALLSREDPFPLVVMEAATHGVPTVAFRDAGGAVEFIQEDAGTCSPFLDLPAFASSLVELLENEDMRLTKAATARARVHALHAPEVALPQIVQVIEQVARTTM